MQKVYIRGVQGRGKEVIAKLEALGGKDSYNINGNISESIYYIDCFGVISSASIHSAAGTSLMWEGIEIFLDDLIEELKPMRTIKTYDPVMVSNDGEIWHCAMYYKSNIAIKTLAVVNTIKDAPTPCEYKYIVPCTDFNYDNPMSNIKRSIV